VSRACLAVSHDSADPVISREGRRHPTRDKDLATVPEIASELGVNPETLYRLIRTGGFPPAVRIGSKILISRPKLERFLHAP
jgi:excisionase family DNA binding protein